MQYLILHTSYSIRNTQYAIRHTPGYALKAGQYKPHKANARSLERIKQRLEFGAYKANARSLVRANVIMPKL